MASLISYVLKFILRRSGIFGKPGASITAQRARMEKMASLLRTPAWLAVTSVEATGVSAEWDRPAAGRSTPAILNDSAILYIHGGSWSLGSPRSHRSMVAQLARAAGMNALSINYRLAPEHPFPAALDDCLSAYRWLLSQGMTARDIAFAGDSSGGNLVLAALLALRDAGEPLPAAAACLSPASDLAGLSELLPGMDSIARQYAGSHDLREPLISPLYGNLRGLPPILIHVGNQELLLRDASCFVERACAAGVDAQLVVWPGMGHVFQMVGPIMPESRESIRQLGSFIREKTR